MKSELDIKMLIGAQEELLKTHEKECNPEVPKIFCIAHVVINERIKLLKKILD